MLRGEMTQQTTCDGRRERRLAGRDPAQHLGQRFVALILST